MTKKKSLTKNLYAVGLKEGDVLYYKNNPEISAVVISHNKVLYNGREISISVARLEVETGIKHPKDNKGWSRNGWETWYYNNKLLFDIRQEVADTEFVNDMKAIVEDYETAKKI